jgi:hypothetical protein
MAEALPTSSHPQEIKDRVPHFLTGYRLHGQSKHSHALTDGFRLA